MKIPLLFTYRNFRTGETISFKNKSSQLLFILSGKIITLTNSANHTYICAGQFTFISPHYIPKCKSLETSSILTVEISSVSQLQKVFPLDILKKECIHITKYQIQPYPINKETEYFLYYIKSCIKNDIIGDSFNESKLAELFLYLKKYYTLKDIAHLFFPIINYTFDFHSFILSNYKKVKSVNEFATLAHCSLSTFKRKFLENMHAPPGKWMTEKKKADILNELHNGGKKFIEISEEYNFSSRAHFSFFCKKHFGKSPQTLRNEYKFFKQPSLKKQL